MKFFIIFILCCILHFIDSINIAQEFEIDKLECVEHTEICGKQHCSLEYDERSGFNILNWSCFITRKIDPLIIRTALSVYRNGKYNMGFDITHNYCEFITGDRSEIPFKYFWSYISQFTNLADHCPIEGFVQVKDFLVTNTTGWPLIPPGKYLYDVSFLENDQLISYARIYYTAKPY